MKFSALGFDLEYQWYGAHKANLSDAEPIYNDGPYDYELHNDFLGDYPYVYCVATSTENGNVVEIQSSVRKILDNVIKLGDGFEFDWYDGDSIIVTDEVEITAEDFANVFNLSDGCTYKLVTSEENSVYYGSDTKIEIYCGEDLFREFYFIIMGDVNGDSVVDVLDVSLTEKLNGIEFPGSPEIAADMDEDYNIDVSDYQAVVNKALST